VAASRLNSPRVSSSLIRPADHDCQVSTLGTVLLGRRLRRISNYLICLISRFWTINCANIRSDTHYRMKLTTSILTSFLRKKRTTIEECESPDRTQTIDISLISTFLALIVTVVSIIDRLTPAFIGLFSYRSRIATGIAFAAFALGLSLKIIRTTHTCKGRIEGNVVRHFSYKRSYRLQAKLAIIPIFVALLLSIQSLKFFKGVEGPVEATIVGGHGDPVAEVMVDAVNLDESSTTQRSTVSDSRGLFVLDLVADNGRPAYLILRWKTCMSKQAFPDELLHELEVREKSNVDTQSRPKAIIRLDCAGG